jgi:hypothetical protein
LYTLIIKTAECGSGEDPSFACFFYKQSDREQGSELGLEKLTISISVLTSEFLGPLMKNAAFCGSLYPSLMRIIKKSQECAYGQLLNLIFARSPFRAIRSGVSSGSETTSRLLLRFPDAFCSARSCVVLTEES